MPVLRSSQTGDMYIQVAGAALGRSWHNTWLGYAADFGIPLSVIQAVLYLSILVLCYRCFKFYGNASMLGVFAVYLLIFTIRDLIASHTSGHSALDAWHRWWMYGILISIYYAIPRQKKSAPVSVGQSLTRPMPEPAMALPSHRRVSVTRVSQ
jgi:O-antigen ligase